MIRETKYGKVFVTVPSVGRWRNVKRLEKIIGPATWIVLPEEEVRYVECGASNTVPCEGDCTIIDSHNTALEEAFKRGMPCAMIDDDMQRIRKITPYGLKSVEFDEVLAMSLFELLRSPLSLCGVKVTDRGAQQIKELVTYSAFVRNLIVVSPSSIRFDKNLIYEGNAEKVDLDFCLQHIHAYGGCIRLNDIIAYFEISYWDDEKMAYDSKQCGGLKKNIRRSKYTYDYIRKKWGDMVVPTKQKGYKYQLKLNHKHTFAK